MFVKAKAKAKAKVAFAFAVAFAVAFTFYITSVLFGHEPWALSLSLNSVSCRCVGWVGW